MKNEQSPTLFNRILSIENVVNLGENEFRNKIAELMSYENSRLLAFFTIPKGNNYYKFYAIIAIDSTNELHLLSFNFKGKIFKSFTPDFPQFHLFEREIHEQEHILPEGHPWLKSVRFPVDENSHVGEIDFFRIASDEVHQVAVGPVHAGIIEPGHFRFQCHGEIVHHLEISLGYQHRGIEQHLNGGPFKSTSHLLEVTAGDSSIAHATAYARIIEKLSNTFVDSNLEKIRAVALELERCANHIGDLGAMAGDIAYLPTMSYCGRIRGDFLNMTALLCGNRFGRGLVRSGGTASAITLSALKELKERLEMGKKDFISAVSLLWDSTSVLSRFENVGTVSKESAEQLGMVGVAARACGILTDARQNFPDGIYKSIDINVPISDTGDVYARARVRWDEVLESIAIIENLLTSISPCEKETSEKSFTLSPNRICISIEESWRGELVHIAITDSSGKFEKYKIIDPSFHNWTGLALALRGEQISDFPICNKSFNLSYCGFDL